MCCKKKYDQVVFIPKNLIFINFSHALKWIQASRTISAPSGHGQFLWHFRFADYVHSGKMQGAGVYPERSHLWKLSVNHGILDCSAIQAVTFETTTRLDKGTSPTTGVARPVYTTVV